MQDWKSANRILIPFAFALVLGILAFGGGACGGGSGNNDGGDKQRIKDLESQVSEKTARVQKLEEQLSEPFQEAAKWKYLFFGGVLLAFIFGAITGISIGSKTRKDSLKQKVPEGEPHNEG
ncbi:MAG: hypothetical protein NTV86_02550 [Planctomycetota bacterium]|nr:hypothetical protein [Planctomycetota bacterium]